jgi:hypothetical protein
VIGLLAGIATVVFLFVVCSSFSFPPFSDAGNLFLVLMIVALLGCPIAGTVIGYRLGPRSKETGSSDGPISLTPDAERTLRSRFDPHSQNQDTDAIRPAREETTEGRTENKEQTED